MEVANKCKNFTPFGKQEHTNLHAADLLRVFHFYKPNLHPRYHLYLHHCLVWFLVQGKIVSLQQNGDKIHLSTMLLLHYLITCYETFTLYNLWTTKERSLFSNFLPWFLVLEMLYIFHGHILIGSRENRGNLSKNCNWWIRFLCCQLKTNF